MLARLLVRRGEYKKAIDEFGGAAALAAISAAAPRAELQTTLAQAHLSLGNTSSARDALAVALAAKPDHPPALVLDARLKAADGDVPGALALVETTLAKSPTLSDGWQLKGDLLLSQKQVEPALAAYRSALETKPDQVVAHHMIVTLLLQTGKIEEARKQLEAMQKVLPKNPQTSYLQALIAYQDKNYAGAREAIQQHLKAAPGSMLGLLLGAQIDYQLGSRWAENPMRRFSSTSVHSMSSSARFSSRRGLRPPVTSLACAATSAFSTTSSRRRPMTRCARLRCNSFGRSAGQRIPRARTPKRSTGRSTRSRRPLGGSSMVS